MGVAVVHLDASSIDTKITQEIWKSWKQTLEAIDDTIKEAEANKVE